MEDNLYFQILEYLAKNGINNQVSISHLATQIPVPVGTPHTAMFLYDVRKGYLNAMQKNQHIVFTISKDANSAHASITKDGWKFLYDNKSTLLSMAANKRSVISICISALALLLALITFIYNVFIHPKSNVSQRQPKQLSRKSEMPQPPITSHNKE